MLQIRQLLRLIKINRVLIHHGLDEILLHIPVFRPLRFLYYLAPWNLHKRRQSRAPLGERIRLALEDLGPVFIKFGQVLSTRNDLLPPDIGQQLKKLQDKVPPFASVLSRQLIEKAYKRPVTEVFKSFETEPMASASIAQVHAAVLWDDTEVIVKVVRPDIRPVIEQDIQLLYLIASMANRYWKEARRLRPVEVVEEYEMTILDELDLIREAANASQLRRNFEGSANLYVPEVFWDYTRDNVLVLERIYGIPVGEIEELEARNVNMKRLGELGVEIFFTQVFRHNFFHADMHPGNIFVDVTDPDKPFYNAVDFGIVGTLTPDDQRYLAENMHAFFNRDYKRVAELHVESGWVPAATRVNDFESAIRTVCEPIFNRPLRDISFGLFLLRLFQTARRFDMQVQPQLVLLQKTLLNIEGLGRQLYPELDLWITAKPFMQRWMDEQVGVRSLMKGVKNNLPRFIEQLPHMPTMLNEVIMQMHSKQLRMQWESEQLEQLRRETRRNSKRIILSIAGSALLVCAVIVLMVGESKLFGDYLPGALMSIAGAVLIATAYFRR